MILFSMVEKFYRSRMKTEHRYSIRKRKLAHNIYRAFEENVPIKSIERELVKVGYAETTAGAKQKEILQSDEVQNELKALGFSEENAKRVVASILNKGKEENRLRAADMVFKNFGSYAPERHLNLNIDSPLKELSIEELEQMAYNKAETKENEAPQAP